MMSEKYIQNNPIRVAVDLGGTYVRAQRFNGGLPEKAPIRICCPSQGSEEEVVDAIIGLIASCVTPKTEGIGIAVPSIVDTHEGIVYDVCNIPDAPTAIHVISAFYGFNRYKANFRKSFRK